MIRYALILSMLCLAAGLSARTLYVDNVKGSDDNDGSLERPVASIEKGLSLLETSGRLEVAPNNGKPYQRPYYGVEGKSYEVKAGGTATGPAVINGNMAVLSGLAQIPADRWQSVDGNLYKLPFWPMSNRYKIDKSQDYWLVSNQIFFIDGQAGRNCLSMEELKTATAGGFWWSRSEKSVYLRLPEGKRLNNLKIELPANSGFYTHGDHVVIENFIFILSWNDGFDAAEKSRNVLYRNCVAIDNCGQAFSTHGSSMTTYEDCVAIRNASSGACDVHYASVRYLRTVFYNNSYEAGVAANDNASQVFSDCLIYQNRPFEQIWQNNYSRQLFDNCLVVGADNNLPLAFSRHGVLGFKQCTLLNAAMLCRDTPGNRGTVTVENSLVGNMNQQILLLAEPSDRFTFNGNLYWQSPGISVGGKLYHAADFAAYQEANRFDRNSAWSSEPLAGWLNSELKTPVRSPNRIGQNVRIGALLPDSVKANFEKYRKVKTSPAGISFE